jgi:hypothetical protein
LQVNLNAAIGKRYGPLKPDGDFGRLTKAAVERFQTDFRLKQVDGKVGPETRAALATRVLIIEGGMTRTLTPPAAPKVPSVPSVPSKPPALPAPAAAAPPDRPFLLQLQPAFGTTPPPFIASKSAPGSTVIAGQLALGLIYRTASQGPHWEFGGALQPSFNSRNSSTDPRYTLQIQGSVAYADPFSSGRFHTQLFSQVVLMQNLAPSSTAVGLQLGGQLSVDIINDRWSLFAQGVLAGQWTLHSDSGGQAGQVQFGPQFTLGTTIQWGL